MTDADYTHLLLVIDRSGSMSGIAADMNGGIKALLREQAEQPGDLRVDVVTFDHDVEFPYENFHALPLANGGDLLHPRGRTALNDATGLAIVRLGEKLAALSEDERPAHVIVVVVTDGMENASREYSTEQVRAMVTEQTERWGWQFIYLAANVDAFATGKGYGYAAGQTMNFAPSAAGTQSMLATASAGITRTRSGLSGDFTEAEREAAMATSGNPTRDSGMCV